MRRNRAATASRQDAESRQGPLQLVFRIVFDVLAIAAEMLAIPARLWMRVAEAAGAIVLTLAEALWPLLVAIWRAGGNLVRWGAQAVTPARATVIVAVAAAIALGASQFSDYRTVNIGAPQYVDVESVAPAPEVASRDPRSAHGDWLLLIAVAGIGVICLSAVARPRVARLLVPLGLGAVAVAVFHDHDVGLQTGRAGIAYEGAEASLLSGYWAEIAAGLALAACGPLLALNLGRHEPVGRIARRRHPLGETRSRPAGVTP